VPNSYRVKFVNPDPGRLKKANWTVAELDRLLASAEGWCHNPDGTPMMVESPHGLVQKRKRPDPAWPGIGPFCS